MYNLRLLPIFLLSGATYFHGSGFSQVNSPVLTSDYKVAGQFHD